MPRYAAIDIGSNSVRMMAAEVDRAGQFNVLAEDRQVTRLGESVFRTGAIDKPSFDLLSTVLTRMVAAYQPLGVLAVRAVATAAVKMPLDPLAPFGWTAEVTVEGKPVPAQRGPAPGP